MAISPQNFFKPTNGFGGRAAYRGDKITKRVWQEILAGHYVAQPAVAPADRVTGSKEEPLLWKFDLRSYADDGQMQWTAARMYQGQVDFTPVTMPRRAWLTDLELANDMRKAYCLILH